MNGWWKQQRSGGAMVEFAITLPLLTILMFGIIEAGQAWRQEQVLATAAREGARVGAIYNATFTADTVLAAVNRFLNGGGVTADSVVIKNINMALHGGTEDTVTVWATLRFPVLSRLSGGLLPGNRPVGATAVFHNE